jgi:hypothetical protein
MYRKSIDPSERLALAIRYLATGETFQALSFQFRIGTTTISQIVMEVCVAIYRLFGNEYLKTPNTAGKWNEIAELFYSRWNIPNNTGAIDGKMIVIGKSLQVLVPSSTTTKKMRASLPWLWLAQSTSVSTLMWELMAEIPMVMLGAVAL